jgi:hypothetical protein
MLVVGAPAHSDTTPGPFVTFLFSRTEVGLAVDCRPVVGNLAPLSTTVAPWLASQGLTATGTIVTRRTAQNTPTCAHWGRSLTATWSQAAGLAARYGWTFVSHTATYPSNMARLTPAQQSAETCGSGRTLDAHGLPGAHGMVAYPGAQPLPERLQETYGSRCFAWGRSYGGGPTTTVDGATFPYWQHNGPSPNGGACHLTGQPCSRVVASGTTIPYILPAWIISSVRMMRAGQWMTIQAYLLVTGHTAHWDCSSRDVLAHWTDDNERYCWTDWQQIARAVRASRAAVTDPLSVGVAFGRPSTYP